MKLLIEDCLKFHLRRGRLFKKLFDELNKREKYSFEQLKMFQEEKLQNVVETAYKRVPFYRRIFDQCKLTPQDIKSISDLKRLPLIDKQTVQENFKDFRNKKFKDFTFKGYTSGTTGSPGAFLRDLYSINFEHAIFWRYYRWGGKPFDSKRVTLRGDLVCPARKQMPPFWRYNSFNKELIMSSYHLSDQFMHSYVDKILELNPYDLSAYPSSAYILADFCKRSGRQIKLAAVFTASEKLLDYQREAIENTFGCKIFDSYGDAERVAAFTQCEHGSYHEMTDYSIVEYLPCQDGLFEVVGTTLHNSVMPLIRYKTGDLVQLDSDAKCECGRKFKVIKEIVGRNDDVIILSDGRKLGRLDHIFKNLSFVKEAQLIQESMDTLIIKIAPKDGFVDAQKEIISERLNKYIGEGVIRFDVRVVADIDRERSGKFKFVKVLMKRSWEKSE